MRYLTKTSSSSFCVTQIFELREKFKVNICYKKKYHFLKLKYTPTRALANRLTKRGNYLKTYKLLKTFFYYYFLTKNFKTIPITSNFLFFYSKYYSFRDLDRVLIWKYNQLDCMFANKVKKFKKKKTHKSTLIFINSIKRTLLCINFLKYTILLNSKRKQKNMTHSFFNPLHNYLIHDKNNLVLKIKYKIYSQKLLQLLT